MKRIDALKFAVETIDRLETIPGVAKEELDRPRGNFSVREILRGRILSVLWDEFGPFDNQPDNQEE